MLAGRFPVERRASDVTGIALQDLTVARMLQKAAGEIGAGTRMPWPW